MKFAVIGGDDRFCELNKLICADGYKSEIFLCGDGFDMPELSDVDVVILPVPVSKVCGELNTPLHPCPVKLDEVFVRIPNTAAVLCGKLDEFTSELAKRYGLKITDYFACEDFTMKNADITAEGAVSILMQELHRTISGGRFLVLGYGRIGKLMSQKLGALGGKVTVAARNEKDLAYAKTQGHGTIKIHGLSGKLNSFDAVINTVPHLILSEFLLHEVQQECVILDLASKPGGVDFPAAEKLGLKTVWALSLPGKYAPISAAEAIKDTIYNIMNIQGGA